MQAEGREVQALTLWQPWASFVVGGVKWFETRSWKGPLGWLAIHAAKREPGHVRGLSQVHVYFREGLRLVDQQFEELPRGCVLGLAQIGGVERVEGWRLNISCMEHALGDWSDGRWAWRVNRVWLFPEPVPARGRQGVWVWRMPKGLAVAFREWKEEVL